ncbi:acyl-CoA dehydrogenase/oxidase C-terminal [Xylariales sp. PMI_506]|nr:acyl-CoA dehydrogenase/oxidase C-terminal [Xylariales sp. PMI_506]
MTMLELNSGPRANRQTSLMAEARAQTSINVEVLAQIIHGGASTLRLRREAWERVESTLECSDTWLLPQHYVKTSREDLYLDGLRLGKATRDDKLKYGHNFFDWITPRYSPANNSPFGLTVVMFNKMLKNMATPQQQQKWLRLAELGHINGAFVQTELGHGTFLRGIETTATFDVSRDCFILNSPTTTSTKYWPGALGLSASHGIIMAKLITSGKDHGVHPFLLQLRDVKSGDPTPGVELGDVGPKPSHNQNDNGYAVFTNVPIPRENMLMAIAQVSRGGEYRKVPGFHPKAAYATMMSVRANIVWICSIQLAATATIAIRYSTVREQGNLAYHEERKSGSPRETAIIHYKSQLYRLLTRLAEAYAILFASKHCINVQNKFESRQEVGDHGTMASAHALTAGMKAWATSIASDGAEDVRKCCGGAGYLAISGLPELVYSLTALCTLEGENYVMWQETARYLVRWAERLMSAKDALHDEGIPQELRYLANHPIPTCTAKGDGFLVPGTQLAIFAHRAQRLFLESAPKFTGAHAQGTASRSDTWNEHMMLLISTARAHVEYLALEKFIAATETISDPTIRRTLGNLCSLFALSAITSPMSLGSLEFVEDGFLSSVQLKEIRQLVNRLLQDLKPEICGLTDAWDFTDAGLCSAIGAKDGNVYERLMSWTRQLPINKPTAEQDTIREEWKDFMHSSLSSKL